MLLTLQGLSIYWLCISSEIAVIYTIMTTCTKSQLITRNGKTYQFFPDITIDDLTKGFLIDIGSPLLPDILSIWNAYCETENASYFGVFISMRLVSTQARDIVYSTYQSLPTSLVQVVGMTVPKQSVVIRKKRIQSL